MVTGLIAIDHAVDSRASWTRARCLPTGAKLLYKAASPVLSDKATRARARAHTLFLSSTMHQVIPRVKIERSRDNARNGKRYRVHYRPVNARRTCRFFAAVSRRNVDQSSSPRIRAATSDYTNMTNTSAEVTLTISSSRLGSLQIAWKSSRDVACPFMR